VQFWRTNSALAIAAVVVIHAKATKTEMARVRTNATMVASSSTTLKTVPRRLLHTV
jgi:hypothetical protein